jgi:hypothetical protein
MARQQEAEAEIERLRTLCALQKQVISRLRQLLHLTDQGPES